MYMENEEIINDFAETRNLSQSTKNSYSCRFNDYTKFTGKTLKELLKEAEAEEEQGIRWKKRKLKKRLITYRNYLTENFKGKTAKAMFNAIKTFYTHYEIEIHSLPPWNERKLNNTVVNYSDLPDKEIIKASLDLGNKMMQALILFMSSSGCARRETLNLTIDDFIQATNEYHNETDIFKVIEKLDNMEDVIPVFKIRRQKTNKHYITFCSPEAVQHIINYLKTRGNKLNTTYHEKKLFKTNTTYLTELFAELNAKMGLGKVGTYNRFRSHMLRKFNASQLYNDGCTMEFVDSIQGRGKDSTHSSYFLENPEKLKQEYINHLDCLMVKWDSITYKSPEYIELESESKEKDEKIKNYETLFDEWNDKIKSMEEKGKLFDDNLEKLEKLFEN